MKAHSISFTISETEIAYAVLKEQQVIFWEICSFLSEPLDTLKTATGVVQRCINRFSPEAAIFESVETPAGPIPELCRAAREVFRQLGIPVFEIAGPALMRSFGYPPPKDAAELRKVVAAVFADLPAAPFAYPCLQAAALGLHFETDRLLNH
jgi:hypothetical protein